MTYDPSDFVYLDEDDYNDHTLYEGLTSEEYDVEEEEEGEGPPIMGPMTGFELYIVSKYAGAENQVISDKDTGYGPNSYFARAMIRE